MSEEEKELLILKFIYLILNKSRNRYSNTMFGNIPDNKIIYLTDCIKYIENKYNNLVEDKE